MHEFRQLAAAIGTKGVQPLKYAHLLISFSADVVYKMHNNAITRFGILDNMLAASRSADQRAEYTTLNAIYGQRNHRMYVSFLCLRFKTIASFQHLS